MSRFSAAGNSEAAAASNVRMATFAHIALPTPVYANNSPLDVVTTDTSPNITWTGVGQLGRINVIREDTEINAAPVTLSLSGIPSTMLTSLLEDDYRNEAVNIYIGFFDQEWRLIAGLAPIFQGVIDSASLTVGEGTAEITLVCENQLSYLIGRPIPIRYTDQEQRKRYSGDLFFSLLPAQFNVEIEWGGHVVSGGYFDVIGPLPTFIDTDPR